MAQAAGIRAESGPGRHLMLGAKGNSAEELRALFPGLEAQNVVFVSVPDGARFSLKTAAEHVLNQGGSSLEVLSPFDEARWAEEYDASGGKGISIRYKKFDLAAAVQRAIDIIAVILRQA